MANNHLEIFQKDTKDIAVLVQGITDLNGYDAYLSVKVKSSDPSTVLFKVGVCPSNPSTATTITFHLDETDTSLGIKDYVYDVHINGIGNSITLVKDVFSIIDNCYV